MQTFTFEEDGIYAIQINPQGRGITVLEKVTAMIRSNVDEATVELGYTPDEGTTFVVYPDGDITTLGGAVINSGLAMPLAVQITGISSHDVIMDFSNF